tara:strand:+ start:39 stop:308 length:270 start_codon:yes stop_codon:yes gene_type:complete
MNRKEAKKLIEEAIEENNFLLPIEKKINLHNLKLGDIDSLQLVNLIILIEEKISDLYKKEVVLSFHDENDKALNSIDNLSDYLVTQVSS